MKYVNVVIDNKSDSTDNYFTYGCHDDDVSVGQKVYVPFARSKKLREAYVFQVLDTIDSEFKGLKYVDSIDESICLTKEVIETCIWLRKRYFCRYIDAVKLFVPAGNPSKRGKLRKPYKDNKGEEQNIETTTTEQEQALKKIWNSISKNEQGLFLLHGVTGSGKTEIYMQAIEECIRAGKTAIMLVPEISLTKQIIDRFIGRFSNENIAVLHSKLSSGERYDEWMRIRKGQVKIVIGARSAVFAPLENIGIIILDEEHEATYKSDMTPKYETVEVAIKRTKKSGGVVLMGSATPSVVSYKRSELGIYEKLTLTERYNKNPLPEVKVVDMRKEIKMGNKTIFSKELFLEMEKTLKEKKQIILFLNRRGYSTFVSCRECGYVLRCPNCGVSLTYHKNGNSCTCHYCGYTEPIPNVCPKCNSKYIRYFGSGTEKVEETVCELFEDASVARLDLDTMKKKGAVEKILKDFGDGKTNILTGTQLVAKGLDFKNIGLVGIISADVSLNIPDYRSSERTFQLITQAAGRAGRGNEKGKVVIQTYTPEHYAVESAASQDYESFYKTEIELRELMEYPPFTDLIQIVFSSKKDNDAYVGACSWENELHRMLANSKNNILSPKKIDLAVNKEEYKYQILIKAPLEEKKIYMGAIDALKRNKSKKKNYNVIVDVNPYSLWRS